jgi:hypothetical protein
MSNHFLDSALEGYKMFANYNLSPGFPYSSGQCLFLRVILSYARSNINNSILQYSLYQRLTNEM